MTANLVVRNSAIRFDPEFIKTGGGEDIDYCLQLKRYPLISVPEAIATHPWWSDGNRTYGHFYRWAIGDSLLMDKYPHLTYRIAPNVWEVTLILLVIMLFSWNARLLGWILSVWLADVVMDVYHLMTDEDKLREHSARGWLRLLAAIESNLVKNSCELGHLMGPMIRNKSLSHITKRFDWFCGLEPVIPSNEQKKHLRRFGGFIFAISMWMLIF